MNSYQKAKNSTLAMPKFYLGQEVETEDGIGIIVKQEMEWNGLYISPKLSSITVWYSTESSISIEGSSGKYVSYTYNIEELQKKVMLKNYIII